MSDLKTLRAELGLVNDLLADARAREVTAVLAPAKYYDPATLKKWSGRGAHPKWLVGKRLEDYAIDVPQPQP